MDLLKVFLSTYMFILENFSSIMRLDRCQFKVLLEESVQSRNTENEEVLKIRRKKPQSHLSHFPSNSCLLI
jgi:hypothetical protein